MQRSSIILGKSKEILFLKKCLLFQTTSISYIPFHKHYEKHVRKFLIGGESLRFYSKQTARDGEKESKLQKLRTFFHGVLPLTHRLTDSLSVNCDLLNVDDPEEVKTAREIFRENISSMNPLQSDFVSFLTHHSVAFSMTDTKTGRIIGVNTLSSSAHCRAVEPPLLSGYIVMRPEFRGGGAGTSAMSLHLELGDKLGFRGFSARGTTMHPAMLVCKTANMKLTGVLPNSVYHREGLQLDDLIFYTIRKDRVTTTTAIRKLFSAKPRQLTSKQDMFFKETIVRDFSSKFFTKVKLRETIEPSDINIIHRQAYMLATNKNKPSLFIRDEFFPDGSLLGRFIQTHHYVLVHSQTDNSLLGALLFGSSDICRIMSSTECHMYAIPMTDSMDFTELWSSLMLLGVEIAIEAQNYKALSTDILTSDVPDLFPALNSNGFDVVATLKLSGTDQDSLLLRKEL